MESCGCAGDATTHDSYTKRKILRIVGLEEALERYLVVFLLITERDR